MAPPVYCRAELTYQGDAGVGVAVTVDILDGRADLEDREFATSGFTMCAHSSDVDDWSDQQQIDRVHSTEVQSFATQFTGCDLAIVYPALLRGPSQAAATPDYAPIHFVHSDFTTDYGPMLTDPDRPYQQFMQPRLAAHGLTTDDLRNASRLMVLQLWRNTGATTPDFPLAICDAQSIDAERLRPFTVEEYGGQNLAFETYGVAPSGADEPDRWYTFPGLSTDEVLVFRTYDSARAEQGQAFWTPHSAFRDPHASAGVANQRESTEMRALCIWR